MAANQSPPTFACRSADLKPSRGGWARGGWIAGHPDANQLFFDNNRVLCFLSLTNGSLNARLIKC
jgi:hypothetical protein